MKAQISVVIPLYNGAQFIRRAVNSVLSQTYADFELIVVDDGSTDNGAEIVQTFSDSRIRLEKQQNAGVSAARNVGIIGANGEYIAFLDADDEWDSGFLEAVYNLTSQYPNAGIYATGYRMVFPRGSNVEVTVEEAINRKQTVLVSDYFRRAIGGSLINASGVMIPRSIFAELGTFLVGEHAGEDLELWARIALHYPIAYDVRILFSFYQTPFMLKPRYKQLPGSDPKVKMLHTILEKPESITVTPGIIRLHIKRYLVHMFLTFASASGRAAAVNYMRHSNAAIYAPTCNALLRVQLLWPLFKLFAWAYRLAKSRLFRALFCRQRTSYGVLERLAE